MLLPLDCPQIKIVHTAAMLLPTHQVVQKSMMSSLASALAGAAAAGAGAGAAGAAAASVGGCVFFDRNAA
jgi:hypothetical protein